MLENSLTQFLKTDAPTKPPQPDVASQINKTMHSLFSLTPITTPFTVNSTLSTTGTMPTMVAAASRSREILVARYGKIYKRKACSPMTRLKLPTAPGFQYCRLCDSQKPNSAFYTRVKRFVCRKCHYQRVNTRFKERCAEDHEQALSFASWYHASVNRIWFGYPKLQFDSTTIGDIVKYANIPWSLRPIACPIDPSLPMRPRNVAILTRKAYTLLLQMWKHTCSRGGYIAFVQRCNLVPRNFDVAFPCTPYHDSTYMRPIIDVAPILDDEQRDPVSLLETSDQSLMRYLRGEQPPTPVSESTCG
jgi:hypothetical protein